MQKRVRKIASFFAFNTLFFALYLNLIHKDKDMVQDIPQHQAAAFGITSPAGQPAIKTVSHAVALNK